MPGILSRIRDAAGSPHRGRSQDAITAGTTINLPDVGDYFLVTNASATCTSLLTPTIRPGRLVTLVGNANNTVTMTDTSGAATRGTMDLGGSNRSFVQYSVITLRQNSTGGWFCVSYVL